MPSKDLNIVIPADIAAEFLDIVREGTTLRASEHTLGILRFTDELLLGLRVESASRFTGWPHGYLLIWREIGCTDWAVETFPDYASFGKRSAEIYALGVEFVWLAALEIPPEVAFPERYK